MTERPSLLAIGLMSGTSLDGVDAAILGTDGVRIETIGPPLSIDIATGRGLDHRPGARHRLPARVP